MSLLMVAAIAGFLLFIALVVIKVFPLVKCRTKAW